MNYDRAENAKLRRMLETLRTEKKTIERWARAQHEADGRVIAQLSKALREIRDKWVPAILRDAREPDKTHCNALSVRSVIVRVLPGETRL